MSQDNLPRNVRSFRDRKMTAAVSTYEVTSAITDTIRRAFGNERNVAKRLAREAGASERAAKNWLEQKNAMTLAQFFTLARRMPELKALAAQILEIETALNPEVERDLARLMRTLQRNEELRREANGGPVRGLDGPPAHGPVGLARQPGRDLDAPQTPVGAAAE